MRLKGKVALITGAGSGIGRQSALLFAREGASVVAVDVNEQAARDTAKVIPSCLAVTADVSKAQDCERMVAEAEKKFGRLDVLFNNAGIMHAKDDDAMSTDEAVWDLTLDINAKGVFLGTKAAIPAMRQAGGGSIINISSQLGLVGMDESSPQYQASKGAVRLLTKLTALQYARERIRANSVHPGPILTPMTERRRADPAVYERMVSRIPLGRYGEPDEVAYGVLYLASDESSFVTGSELVIDGGWTAQ